MRVPLSVEAMLLGFPITVLFAIALPFLLIGLAVAITTPSIEAAWLGTQAFCSLFAFVQYWRLAAKTVHGQRMPLGFVVWFSVACAFVAAFFAISYCNGSIVVVLAVLAAFVATGHFVVIQRSINRHDSVLSEHSA